MKKSLVALASLAVLSLSAHADGLTGNLSLTSKYKYRGQDQSDTETYALPAVQGGFDYTAGNFYVGNWNSAVGFAHGTEMDFYGGMRGEVSGMAYDVGILTYFYPGTSASALNTTEIYGGLTFGMFTAKYSHTVSDEYFGVPEASNTGYLDLSANYEFAKGWTANGHLGYTNFSGGAKDAGAANYVDYKIGATYDYGSGLSVAAAYIGADKDDKWGPVNKDRLILTLTKTF